VKPTARILLITASSSLGGGIFYVLWLVIFLVFTNIYGATQVALLFPLAPPITALGFATAVQITYRIFKQRTSPFLKVYLWPLAGCILGATAVYWYGPMLIVFSMLAVGTLSVALREIKLVGEK